MPPWRAVLLSMLLIFSEIRRSESSCHILQTFSPNTPNSECQVNTTVYHFGLSKGCLHPDNGITQITVRRSDTPSSLYCVMAFVRGACDFRRQSGHCACASDQRFSVTLASGDTQPDVWQVTGKLGNGRQANTMIRTGVGCSATEIPTGRPPERKEHPHDILIAGAVTAVVVVICVIAISIGVTVASRRRGGASITVAENHIQSSPGASLHTGVDGYLLPRPADCGGSDHRHTPPFYLPLHSAAIRSTCSSENIYEHCE